jgi:ferredoxin
VKELQQLAGTLLADGTVDIVIGWEESRHGARPVFVTSAGDAGKLIFDARCVHDLATYLNPRRKQIERLGKRIGIVVKGCDAKAVAGLRREAQLPADHTIVTIGVRCGGVVTDPTLREAPEVTVENVAQRCWGCDVREPGSTDHLVGDARPEPPVTAALDERVAELDAMTPDERWAFWSAEMAKCTRCYACRQACPLCVCERCITEKTQPRWIESSPHARGNLAWNLTRAQHLAGRCVGCGECERACPVGIPLNLLNRKLQLVVAEEFGYRVSEDPEVPAPIGAYSVDDQEEFIE